MSPPDPGAPLWSHSPPPASRGPLLGRADFRASPPGPLLRALNRDGKKSHSFVNVCIAGGGGAEGDLIKARFRLIRLWQPLTRFLPGVSSVATRGGVTTEAPFPSLTFLRLL